MPKYIFFFLIAAAISLILTPLVCFLAKRAKFYDIPSSRKQHKRKTPLLGGVPIFISFNLTLFLGVILNNTDIKEFLISKWHWLLLCQLIILAIGIYDDKKRMPPSIKFLFQLFVGILMVIFGFGIHIISNPFTGNLVDLGVFSIPITIFWVIGIINALNLVDGLDGLAAGVALITCAAIFAISYFNQHIGIALVVLVLAGAITGFLRYNFYPAKIFLGDSGSLLLGFLLAVFSIEGSTKGATFIAVMVPILTLGFPIMETLLSMFRRFLKSLYLLGGPKENGKLKSIFFEGFHMFKADKDHVHHRLIKLGLSHRKTVLVLYAFCIILCVLAFLSVALQNINVVIFLGAIIIAFYIGIKSLNYKEFKILESGLLLPIFDFPVINKKIFQGFLDLIFISSSYTISFVLVFEGFGSEVKDLFTKTIPIVLLVKLLIFFVSKIYRVSWFFSGIEDILKVVKSVFLSSLALLSVMIIIFGIEPFGGFLFFLLDFYLLMTFIIGSRIAYIVVSRLYIRNSADKNGRNILIYGAGHKGSVVVEEIEQESTYNGSVAGFIDDDNKKIGKIFHNYPILGNNKDIMGLVASYNIKEIVISSSKIAESNITKLIEFCKQKEIILRKFEFRFYEFS